MPDAAAEADACEDLSLLRSFASGSGGGHAPRTAVAAAAARAVAGHSSEAQVAARDALAELFKDPPCDEPDALPPLLAAAAAGGTRVGPTFRVGTVAWKVLVAAVVGAPQSSTCDIALRKRILLAAGVAAGAVLDEVLRVFSSAEGGDEVEAAEAELAAERYIKFLRFHSVNMARLGRRFMEQGTVLCAADACTAVVLRNLAAVLSATVVETTAVSTKASVDLNVNVVGPTASAARAVLIMCCSSAEAAAALHASYDVSARCALAQRELAGRLLAVAYFIRCAEAEDVAPLERGAQERDGNGVDTGNDFGDGRGARSLGLSSGDREALGQAADVRTGDGQPAVSVAPDEPSHPGESKAVVPLGELLRGAIASALLPLVLDLSRLVYSSAYRSRTRADAGGHSLAAVAVAAAADCAGRAVPCEELQTLLLRAAASRHAVVSYAARNALVSIAPVLPAILDSIMGLTRLALAADSSSADHVWIPLAAKICCSLWRDLPERVDEHSQYLFRPGRFLDRKDEQQVATSAAIARSPPSSSPIFPFSLAAPSRSLSESPSAAQASSANLLDLADEAGLRVLANVCGSGPPNTPPPDFIFAGIGYSRDAIGRFCKQTLLGSTTPAAANSGVAAACAMLLPHVASPRAAAGAALAVLKRPSASIRLVVAALNSINVAAAALGPLAAALPRALARHGTPLLPVALAFVARALAADPPPSIDVATALRASVAPFCSDLPEVDAPELAASRYHIATITGSSCLPQGVPAVSEHDACAHEEALMAGGNDGYSGPRGAEEEGSLAEATADFAGAVAALASALGKRRPAASATIPVPLLGELRSFAAAVPALAAVAEGEGISSA